MIFLFKQMIFRFQPLIFQGVQYHHTRWWSPTTFENIRQPGNLPPKKRWSIRNCWNYLVQCNPGSMFGFPDLCCSFHGYASKMLLSSFVVSCSICRNWFFVFASCFFHRFLGEKDAGELDCTNWPFKIINDGQRNLVQRRHITGYKLCTTRNAFERSFQRVSHLRSGGWRWKGETLLKVLSHFQGSGVKRIRYVCVYVKDTYINLSISMSTL